MLTSILTDGNETMTDQNNGEKNELKIQSTKLSIIMNVWVVHVTEKLSNFTWNVQHVLSFSSGTLPLTIVAYDTQNACCYKSELFPSACNKSRTDQRIFMKLHQNCFLDEILFLQIFMKIWSRVLQMFKL